MACFALTSTNPTNLIQVTTLHSVTFAVEYSITFIPADIFNQNLTTKWNLRTSQCFAVYGPRTMWLNSNIILNIISFLFPLLNTKHYMQPDPHPLLSLVSVTAWNLWLQPTHLQFGQCMLHMSYFVMQDCKIIQLWVSTAYWIVVIIITLFGK